MVGVTPDNANRLAGGIARTKRIPYSEAVQILEKLTVRIVADSASCERVSGQAALLSAINSAQRAFLGGINVCAPLHNQALLPQLRERTLKEAITLAGYTPTPIKEPTHTIYIGSPDVSAKADDVIVHCDAWRGGSSDVGNPAAFLIGDADNLSLGGTFAGASAVHRCFVRATNLPSRLLGNPCGISLWDPNSDWLSPVSDQHLTTLPNRLWTLGLGHLGQAFLWNMAFLPFKDPKEVEFWLNDFDTISESNLGSGVLCNKDSIGRRKTRHCAEWLELLGFDTVITERHFGTNWNRTEDEPSVAFCGFDSAKSRLHLDSAGFDLVFECGLGGSLANFDQTEMHVFPNKRKSAHDLWKQYVNKKPVIDPSIVALFQDHNEVCGQLAIEVSGNSVSTSFVGLMAGALAVSEILRTFNRGHRFDTINFNARCREDLELRNSTHPFTASALAAMGLISTSKEK